MEKRKVETSGRPGGWPAGGTCKGGSEGGNGACVLCSPVTAPRGGSMLREGTDPSERTRIHPPMHRGEYTPGTELYRSRGLAINPVATPSANPNQPSWQRSAGPRPGSLSSSYKLPGPPLRFQIPIIHRL